MSIYSKRPGIKGSTVYVKDKHLIKAVNVPGNVMTLLETQDVVDTENMILEAPLKRCIFCDAHTKMSRLINGQHVYVCENDYQDKTLGQVAQALREHNTDPLLAA